MYKDTQRNKKTSFLSIGHRYAKNLKYTYDNYELKEYSLTQILIFKFKANIVYLAPDTFIIIIIILMMVLYITIL